MEEEQEEEEEVCLSCTAGQNCWALKLFFFFI
jgi:hypothetical protein